MTQLKEQPIWPRYSQIIDKHFPLFFGQTRHFYCILIRIIVDDERMLFNKYFSYTCVLEARLNQKLKHSIIMEVDNYQLCGGKISSRKRKSWKIKITLYNWGDGMLNNSRRN